MVSLLTCLLPIALSRRTATVESVVNELAEKSGRPLAIARSLRDEVVYVGIGPHEPEVLMEMLARATSAEWTESQGKMWLDRSNSLRRRQAATEQTELTQRYSQQLKLIMGSRASALWKEGTNHAVEALHAQEGKQIPGNGADTPNQVGWRTFTTPMGRLFARILLALPPSQIAAIPVGETARFASRPRRQQGALLGASDRNLRQYASEQRIFLDELGRMNETDREATQMMLRMFRQTREPGSGEQLYALLEVTHQKGDSFAFGFRLYDPQARRVDQTGLIVVTQQDFRPVESAWRNRALVPGPAAASFFEGMREREVDPTQAALAQNPAKQDPLATMLGDAMEAVASARGQETLVALPDQAGNAIHSIVFDRAGLGSFEDGLAECVTFEMDAGVRVGHARRPAYAETTKLDRSALSSLMIQLKGGRFPTLDALGNYAASQNPMAAVNWLEWNTLAGAGFAKARSEMRPIQMIDTGTRDLIRAYGALPPAARTSLRRGNPLPFNVLPPASRADLERFVFRRIAYGSVDGSLSDASAYFDGLPAGGVLAAVPAPIQSIVAGGPGGVSGLFTSMSALAATQFRKQKAGDASLPNTKYLPAWRSSWDLQIRLSSSFKRGGSLTDLSFDPNRKPVSLAELPPEHRAEWQRSWDALKAKP